MLGMISFYLNLSRLHFLNLPRLDSHGRSRVNARSTEEAPGTSPLYQRTYSGLLNVGDRSFPFTVPMTTPLHPSNHLCHFPESFSWWQLPQFLSPNSHSSPPLPPGLPSPLRGLFSPSPSPTHRASPHLCPLTQHPRYLRRSPQDPACSLHSAGHLSPAHTQCLS